MGYPAEFDNPPYEVALRTQSTNKALATSNASWAEVWPSSLNA
jgi:hypothetical protein